MADCEEKKDTVACIGCTMKDRCLTNEDNNVTRAQRWKAILIGYILPFIVLMADILIIGLWTKDEYIIGGTALAAIGIYYLMLYLKKPKV